jgi:hypothetical protein
MELSGQLNAFDNLSPKGIKLQSSTPYVVPLMTKIFSLNDDFMKYMLNITVSFARQNCS